MKAMRFYLTLFVVSALTGLGADRAFAYYSNAQAEAKLDRQCSYDTGSNPRCQYCDGSCLGSGYVCCGITVGPGDSDSNESKS